MSDIRLLLTNDFFGAFFPQPVSWGLLPGGHAVIRLVNRLREGAAASAWIDGGDFSGGGPLAPASDGQLGWQAAATLGIDAAVPGNHEFDYGDDAMLAHSARLPFPIVAADLPSAPAWSAGDIAPIVRDHVVISAPNGRSVAVIGLCLPERRGLFVYDTLTDLPAAATGALELVKTLRTKPPNIDHIVVVIHEGVPIYPGLPLAGQALRAVQQLGPLRDFCRAMAAAGVDAVVGGHTLGRLVGDLGGIPFVQPWALGAEIGIIDIDSGGVTVGAQPVPAAWARPWTGPGADVEAELRQVVVGELDRPLATPARDGAGSLAQAVADGLLEVTGADVAVVHPIDVGCLQLALDGCMGYLPPGPVTEADVLRALPWANGSWGDEVCAAELRPHEIALITTGLAAPGLPAGLARRDGAAAGATAINRNYRATVERLLAREVEWTATGNGQRDGLRTALAG